MEALMSGRSTEATTSTAQATADACFQCDALQGYVDTTTSFANDLSTVLQGPMTTIYASSGLLWIVLTCTLYGLTLTNESKISKEFITILAAGIVLHTCTPQVITGMYKLCLLIMGGLARTCFDALKTSLDTSGYDGIVALAAQSQHAIGIVFDLVMALWNSGSALDPRNPFYAIILGIPYGFIFVTFSAQIIVAIFRAFLVSLFGPYVFFAMSYSWGFPMLIQSARLFMSATIVLFASTACMVLTIYSVEGLSIQTGLQGTELDNFASLTNPQFFVLLFIGIAFAALHFEGVGIANSLCQSFLTNTAAAMMTGGTGAAALAISKMSNPLTAGRRYSAMAKNASENIGGYQQAAGHIKNTTKTVGGIVNKARNLNRPSAQDAA